MKITAPEVADRFIKAFEEDTQALNVQPATLHPRVMDHMPDILAFIEVLIEKGFAYEVAVMCIIAPVNSLIMVN